MNSPKFPKSKLRFESEDPLPWRFATIPQWIWRFLSLLTDKPIIVGKVLTSIDEVAGEPIPKDISPRSFCQNYVLRDTIDVYPLGFKAEPDQFLLRDEVSGDFVIMGRKEFKTLFIER